MKAFWALIPLLIIRFIVLGMLDKHALKRAAYFPRRAGKEIPAYIVYQISNIFIFLLLFFLRINVDAPLFFVGLVVYGFGNSVCLIAAVNFAGPQKNGFNNNGLYKISRHPMYIGYFLYFLGCVLLTDSLLLLALVAVFQVSAHWIILSEERWCVEKFGEEYILYMNKVRRYL